MIDYSSIMQELPRLQRERDDALRDANWQKAVDINLEVVAIERLLHHWLCAEVFSFAQKPLGV
jgi:hypothetical protein